jgi:hypothetical protein
VESIGLLKSEMPARRTSLLSRLEDPLIFIRLEMTSTLCILWVTAIFNRFGLSIRNGTLAAFAAIASPE